MQFQEIIQRSPMYHFPIPPPVVISCRTVVYTTKIMTLIDDTEYFHLCKDHLLFCGHTYPLLHTYFLTSGSHWICSPFFIILSFQECYSVYVKPYTVWLNWFSVAVTKYLTYKILKGERLFWIAISEISVHGHPAPLLLGLWQGRNIMADEWAVESCLP